MCCKEALAIAFLFIVMAYAIPVYAQETKSETGNGTILDRRQAAAEDVFDIIADQNLDNSTIGTYIESEWSRDWDKPSWKDGLRNIEVAKSDDGNAMKFNYPKGSWDPYLGGGQWLAPFEKGLEEVYFSYNVMFKPGFEWVLGGKLPGLGGGSNPGGGMDLAWDDGFSARVMWNKDGGGDGTMFFYVYHQGKTSYYGDVMQFPDAYWDVTDSTWFNHTVRVVINSIDEGKLSWDPHNAGNYDGILEFFLDGKLVFSRSGLCFRNTKDIWVDTRHITSFFGGGDDAWGAARDEWVLFDDTYVYTYKDGVDVPRGRESSKPGRILELPNLKGDRPDPSDTEAPTIPQNVRVTQSSGLGLFVTWDHSTDNVFMKGYRAMINGEEVGTTLGNTYGFYGLTPLTSYDITISAYDASGNESQPSAILSASTLDPDEEAPTVPGNPEVLDLTQTSAIVSWAASTDNVGVSGYKIYLDGSWIGSSSKLRFPLVDLEPSTSYQLTITAIDEFLNESAPSVALEVRTRDPDSESPTKPVGLMATLVAQNSISIVWNPSSDNVGVKGYSIYLGGIYLQVSPSNSFTITNLNPGIEYSIEVSAYDEVLNESLRSDPITVTTRNPDETSVPAMPNVEIVEVLADLNNAEMKTSVNSFGHVDLQDYGVLVSSNQDTSKEEHVIYAYPEDTELIHEGRVKENLQVLYDFSSGVGSNVLDISGTGDPIDLFILNALSVDWLPGQGINIRGNASILTQEVPVSLIESLKETNEISMEAWVRSDEIAQDGPARILSLSRDNFNRAATLGYVGNNAFYNYIARLNTSETDLNGTPEISSSKDFISLNLHHVMYTRSSSGEEKIFVNGVEMVNGTRPGDFSTMTYEYRLSIGNELGGERPWQGTLYLAAIYNRALDTDEVLQNYVSGPGEIQYTLEMPIEPNKAYVLSPFARTKQGVVYGEDENLEVRSLLSNLTGDSIYMAIYPNPTNGDFKVYIEYPNLTTPQVSLRIIDINGRLVYWRDIREVDEFVRKEEIISKSSEIHGGIYAVMLVVGTESIARRLVINN